MYNTMLEAAQKVTAAAGGTNEAAMLGQVLSLGKDFVKTQMDKNEEAKNQRALWEKHQAEKKVAAEKAAKEKATADATAAAAPPPDPRATGWQTLTTGFGDIVEAMVKRQSPEVSGTALANLMRSSESFGWHLGRTDLEGAFNSAKSEPEKLVSVLASYANDGLTAKGITEGIFKQQSPEDGAYCFRIAMQFRKSAGLPPLKIEVPKAPETPAAMPTPPFADAPAAPASSPAPVQVEGEGGGAAVVAEGDGGAHVGKGDGAGTPGEGVQPGDTKNVVPNPPADGDVKP
jgi:hypothetical protein